MEGEDTEEGEEAIIVAPVEADCGEAIEKPGNTWETGATETDVGGEKGLKVLGEIV